MAYDPTRPLIDQALDMAWNNTYDEEPQHPTETDTELHSRMHRLLETEPGVFKAVCASAGIDNERYAADLRENEELTQQAVQEQ